MFRRLVIVKWTLGQSSDNPSAAADLALALDRQMMPLGPRTEQRAPATGACAEVTKRQSNRRRLKRLLKRWGKPYGTYFNVMVDRHRIEYDEEDLRQVCGELKLTMMG